MPPLGARCPAKAGSYSLRSLAPASQLWSTSRKSDPNTLLQMRNATSRHIVLTTHHHMWILRSLCIQPHLIQHPARCLYTRFLYSKRRNLGTEEGLSSNHSAGFRVRFRHTGLSVVVFLIRLPYFPVLKCACVTQAEEVSNRKRAPFQTSGPGCLLAEPHVIWPSHRQERFR